MKDDDFVMWCIKDAAQEFSKGLIIYVVILGAFWAMVG